MAFRLLALAIFSSLLVKCQSKGNTPKVLIFSRTADFRHDSIPTAINALQQQGPSHNIHFDTTEDQTFFTDANLSKYDALVFLSNTGQVLDDNGTNALQNYVNSGGNFVAIHAASDCLRNSTFFGDQVGAHLGNHTNVQNATILVLDSSHPSTSMLPKRWAVRDQIYHFQSNPRSMGAIVLLTADPSTFTDTASDPVEGSPAPKAWYQEHGAGASTEGIAPSIGRSWYTSLGHLNETWQDSTFMAHIMGGITWALASNTTLAFNANAQVGNKDPTISSGASGAPSSNSGPGLPTAQSKNAAMKFGCAMMLWSVTIGIYMFSIVWSASGYLKFD